MKNFNGTPTQADYVALNNKLKLLKLQESANEMFTALNEMKAQQERYKKFQAKQEVLRKEKREQEAFEEFYKEHANKFNW